MASRVTGIDAHAQADRFIPGFRADLVSASRSASDPHVRPQRQAGSGFVGIAGSAPMLGRGQ
jgi:hypothetical protein